MYSLLYALRRRKRTIQKTIIFRSFLSNYENLMIFFRIIRLMSFSHSSKKIMLLKLKIKRNFFINHFTISLKRNCRNFDVILKIHFKKIKFVIRLSLQKHLFSLCRKKMMNCAFMSIIAIWMQSSSRIAISFLWFPKRWIAYADRRYSQNWTLKIPIINFALRSTTNGKRRFGLVMIILNIWLCLLILLTPRQRFKLTSTKF